MPRPSGVAQFRRPATCDKLTPALQRLRAGFLLIPFRRVAALREPQPAHCAARTGGRGVGRGTLCEAPEMALQSVLRLVLNGTLHIDW